VTLRLRWQSGRLTAASGRGRYFGWDRFRPRLCKNKKQTSGPR